jgi:DNA-binding NtrC family response regulator
MTATTSFAPSRRASLSGIEPREERGKRSERGTVLIVDPEEQGRRKRADVLERAGYDVQVVADGRSGLARIDRQPFDVVLLDLNARGLSALGVLSALPALHTNARFIVTTASPTVDSAIEAMKLGAFDYVVTTIADEDLLLLIRRAVDDAALTRTAESSTVTSGDVGPGGLIGRTRPMRRLLDQVERVAPTRANVLVTGETGTGKELVARAVHELSGRAGWPFVPVNCSALPSALLEAELFGHEKGSFTGAVQSRRGLIEEAAGGTLFLDEVGTLSEDVQIKLLRVLQDHQVQRIGGRRHAQVDFRLVAATNTDLADRVRKGTFREDLYYRLHVFPIRVPPLRERREDIPLLANHFALRCAEENGLEPPRLTPQTLARMISYEWPGNVRELENFIERSVILYAGGRMVPFDVLNSHEGTTGSGLLERADDEEWTLDRLEREHILSVLERVHWQLGVAARVLGVNRRTVYRKLRRYKDEGLIVEHEEPISAGTLDRAPRA